MKKTSILAAAAGLAVATGLASAQVYSASPNLQIINTTAPSGTVSSTIGVSGGPSSITDINVIFQATHTWDADIDVILQGPTGYICLTTDNGSSGDNYLTTRFDDASTTSITSGTAPFNNNYRPEGLINGWTGSPTTFTGTNYSNLAGFNGTNANGNWTMYVADDTSGDSGTWTYWSLEFNGAVDPAGPPPLTAPTNPSGVGSYSVASLPNGGTTNFRVTVTPGSNPTSTGVGVTVDGSQLGLGTITLLDDGTNDDGVAGNNIFGKNNVVINGAVGSYTLPFSITDAQSRTGTGSMPALTIQPPPPTCPEGNQPASFSNLNSNDGLNAAINVHPSLGWSGTDFIQDIHLSGRLTKVASGTFASEARIQITFSDASTITLQPFTTTSYTGFIDVADYVFTLPTPKLVSSITDVQLFESFDDVTGSADSTWTTLCLTWNPLLVPTNPTVTGSATPSSAEAGSTVHLAAIASPGANPTSTGMGVTVDGSLIGAGTVTLLDDGINDDGIAGNNVFGANATIDSGTAAGSVSLPVTVTDAQSRSGSNTISLNIVPPAPGCPAGQQPTSFTNVQSFGLAGNAGNTSISLGWTNPDLLLEIHVSGRLTSETSGTWPNDSRLRVKFSDGSSQDIVPFAQTSGFTYVDLTDFTYTVTGSHLASDVTSVELFESFDDASGANDAVWNNLCLSYVAQTTPTNPTITSASITPDTVLEGGANVHVLATVSPGQNPLSTNLSVVAAGGIQMLDDGINDDGIAGNNVFGAFANTGNQPAGVTTYGITVTDDQGRSGTGSVTLNIIPRGQWEESIDGAGDAGELPASAQAITGADGPLASIGGSIDSGDTDMYAITICDPTMFSASLGVGGRTNFDTQLWLFDANGVGVEFNDDSVGAASVLDNSFVTAPGQYYIAVSGYNRDALDSSGALLWNNTPFTGVRAADGPGAANAVSSWTGSGANGTYLLTLSGVCIQNGPACDPDVNQDGVADQGDVDYLINVIAGGENPTGIDSDFNGDGVSDQGDIDAIINVVAGGPCP
ncbi:MAG: hypothetical protein GC200_07795 [Tepidisphaera sp.]|nr:hypothetical protein [Tepidisphaera sp.]